MVHSKDTTNVDAIFIDTFDSDFEETHNVGRHALYLPDSDCFFVKKQHSQIIVEGNNLQIITAMLRVSEEVIHVALRICDLSIPRSAPNCLQ